MTDKKIYHVTFDMKDGDNSLNWYKKSKLIARQMTEHFIVKLIIILLILTDICVVIVLLFESKPYLSHVSFVLACIFLLEVSLRIYGLGIKTFFTNWVNVIDFVIVIITFGVNLVDTIPNLEDLVGFRVIGGARILRLPRIFHLIRILTNKKNYLNSSRYITSENKRRFQLDGYDLDLCYVTNRVIAMSFPSSGLTALYRNSISDVANFFKNRHGCCYKIYNLCEERDYDTKIFDDNVERYMIKDHNVPTVEEMIRFAKSSKQWLSQSEINVIAVHCKGGKGRTGTMICVHLIDSDVFDDADLCLQYFGHRRTDLLQGKKFQGVETPSQSRYVRYFESIKRSVDYTIPEKKVLKIERIIIYGVQQVYNGIKSDMIIQIIQGSALNVKESNILEFNLGEQDKCQIDYKERESTKSLEILMLNSPYLHDDIKIKFTSLTKSVPRAYDNCSFFFWFHTNFIENKIMSLNRDQLDNPHKKSTWKIYGPDFKVDVYFENF